MPTNARNATKAENSTASDRPRGRPRDPAVREAILRAALRQLSDIGFVRMSMDSVALEAGVTKPTLYRRWSSKSDLAAAAVGLLRDLEAPPVTGNLREDLIAQLQDIRLIVDRTVGMALIGTLLAEEPRMPEWLDHFRQSVIVPRRLAMASIVEDAKTRGEVRSDVDAMIPARMLAGFYHAQYLDGGRFLRSWAEEAVDFLIAGMKAA